MNLFDREIKLIKGVSIVILLLLFQLTGTSYSQSNHVFYKLSNKDGLSHNTVNDIKQDSTGILWIATKQGLNKYDSYRFTSYFREDYPEIPSNIINTLCFDNNQVLYFGTSEGLGKYDNKMDQFTELTMNGENLPFIQDIILTSDGSLLIGTSQGLFRYFPEENRIIRHLSLRNSSILALCQLGEDEFLIGTSTGLYNVNNDGIIQDRYYTDINPGMPSNLIQEIYIDSDDNIWIGSMDKGISLFDPGTGIFTPVQYTDKNLAGSEFIRVIRESNDGNIWIGTESGLFILEKNTGKSIHVYQSLEESEHNLNDNAIYALFLSNEDIMWIGTYFGGINYTELSNQKAFKHLPPGNDQNELRGKAVNRMLKDSNGMIWITTEDGGVCTFDPASGKILEYFYYDPDNGLSSNNIHAICEDRNGNIWFGHFQSGIDIYNPKKKKFTHMLPNPEHSDQFEFNSVYTLFTDSRGQLWVGTRTNIKLYDYHTGRFLPFKPEQISGIFAYDIKEDPVGHIWISTRSNGIIKYNPETDSLNFYQNGTSTENGLSCNQIIASMADTRGNMWFGTMEGGVNIYHPETDSFEVLLKRNGLPNNTVYGILEDEDGCIWLSSNSGITRYSPPKADIKNYSTEDGLTQMQFNYGSYFKDQETGTLYFGSISGLTYFDPGEINEIKTPPSVAFTDFKLFNTSVRVGENEILSRHINYTDQIKLKFKENVFSIDFVAINYASSGNNRFYYYLEGFESDWNDAGNRTDVTYTNLSPGNYTFRVKAMSNDGIESSQIRPLQIRILNPWWESTVAIIIYIIIAILIIFITRRAIIIREKERLALNIEKIEKERIMQLNQQRINFFTYISHEFKSPLSIILASIDELSKKMTFNEFTEKHFERFRRSAKRFSFLIGQLMDFRSIETKHARLNLKKGDIFSFLRDTCLAFDTIFLRQEIQFEFHCQNDSYTCWFDPDKIEKIVTNLISNAIKFTPPAGKISFFVQVIQPVPGLSESDLIEIRVSDTGSGMDEKDLEWAFDPFHMNASKDGKYSGTGIGLTLVKSLVEYLGGRIKATSRKGSGTTFTILLPTDLKGATNIKLEETTINGNPTVDLDHISFQTDLPHIVENREPQHSENYILIVEDKQELAEVLISHFSQHYRVSYAKNGDEAMKMVKQEEPDMIISDIVMPGMNGLELCRKIKSTDFTSHIAVILLTGKVSHEDKLEGLKAGAEAYVSKPFDFNELDLHVEHFLEIRRKLKKTLIVDSTLDLSDVKIHDRDKKFIENVTRIINKNIDNESFSVEDLASQLGMSRTLVYLKHKKLINMTAKEYLQLLRFKKAIEIMKKTDESISEIAYEVGFSDPNYFSRAFKKVYHISPTEYKKMMKEMETA